MPSTAVKDLYVAKSMKDLELGITCDVAGRPTNLLVTSARKVFQSAEISFLDKDEEKAYVRYMRFVELVLLLKKRTDFEKNPNRKHLLHSANIAISKAEILKESLSKRYSILQEAICREKNAKNNIITELSKSQVEIADDTSKVLSVELPEDMEKLSITSSELHYLVTSTQSSIIVMDTRSAEDFEKSHIKMSRCINVPQEILNPGLTAAKLESLLPEDSLSQWYRRKEADYIILVDWDAKDENTSNLHLNVLKSAMCKWDPASVLKRTPVVLKGGYKDWMVKYPMFTTQALKFNLLNNVKSSLVLTDLSAIQYPNLDENDCDSSKALNEKNSNNMLFKKSSMPVSVLNDISPQSNLPEGWKSHSAPTVDRKTKPSVTVTPKSAISENKSNKNTNFSSLNGESSLQEKKIPPSVDRKLKNTVSVASDKNGFTKDNLLDSLNKEQSLVKESVEITRKQLKNEEEFEKLRLRKELEAEESKNIEIQKQEELLIQKLRQLEQQGKEKDAAFQKLNEENIKMKKLIEEKLDEDIRKENEKVIARSLKEQAALRESVERLREERKKKEAENLKKRELSIGIPRETTSANSVLKRINNHGDKASNLANSSDNPSSLTRQVSSDNSSRGLVRSHSSPNIAQMINDEENIPYKIPVIDRSLKPKVTGNSQLTEINRARTRNLNPVYGNCPARAATGLRNLGNTCFMNSVIQCLSNTLPLAEYINSGQYVEHISRDNKQGTGGELVEEFAVVIRTLWMGQYKSFYPKDFKNTVSRCLPVCIGNEQQDSHEFLVVLMEKLHADLNRKHSKVVSTLDSNISENAFWQHHKSLNCSKISDIFDGLLKSTLTCLSCRKTSDSFEVFSCLSLPILASRCTLKECFQHFLRAEKISGEAAWDCPRCKQKKEAEKRLRICRLPGVLIIQLKRFSYEGLWRRKLQTHVDFDLTFDVPFEENSHERFRVYSLYGIVNHYGTLEGGHYIAYCKTSTKWFKYDDHEVSEISCSDIKTSAAYLLFYIAKDFHSKL